jgi:hypothetical protein
MYARHGRELMGLIWCIPADRPIDQMARYKIADLLMIADGTFKELSMIIHSPATVRLAL